MFLSTINVCTAKISFSFANTQINKLLNADEVTSWLTDEMVCLSI